MGMLFATGYFEPIEVGRNERKRSNCNADTKSVQKE